MSSESLVCCVANTRGEDDRESEVLLPMKKALGMMGVSMSWSAAVSSSSTELVLKIFRMLITWYGSSESQRLRRTASVALFPARISILL